MKTKGFFLLCFFSICSTIGFSQESFLLPGNPYNESTVLKEFTIIRNSTTHHNIGLGFGSSAPAAKFGIYNDQPDLDPYPSMSIKFTHGLFSDSILFLGKNIETNRYFGIAQINTGNYNYFGGNTGIGGIPSTTEKLFVAGPVRFSHKLIMNSLGGTDGGMDIRGDQPAYPAFNISYNNDCLIALDPTGSSFSKLLKCENFQLSTKNCSNCNGFILQCDAHGNAHWENPEILKDHFWIPGHGMLISNPEINRVGVHLINIEELYSDFQVNSGVNKISIGSMDQIKPGGSCTGYIGFNIARFDNHETIIWITEPGNNGDNGAAAMWASQGGNLYFAPIGSDNNTKSGSMQELTDDGVYDRIRMTLTPSGSLGVNTTPVDGYNLAVKGKILAEEMDVMLESEWPDFVFSKGYRVPDVAEVERYIIENGHLPGVPSGEEVKENGISVGAMNTVLLQKVEELTLYIIALKKEVEALKSQQK